MTRVAWILPLAVLLTGCAEEPKPARKQAEAPPPPARPYVIDERHLFPVANQTESKVVQDPLFGHEFLPGGNLAHYKKGKQEYDLMLVRATDGTSAAILLLSYKKALDAPKVVPGFGGYFGKDGDQLAFLFAKGRYLAGVRGLSQEQADLVSRDFAARIPN
jgi:hypothetical protein